MRLLMVLAAVAAMASPATAQAWRPFEVRFATNSHDLAPEERARLDAVPRQMRATGEAPKIIIAGHADGAEGSAAEAVSLSRRRADIVRDYLTALGVPASNMTTQAFGSTRPAIESTEPQSENRRVEVTFGPGSGW